MEGQSINNKKWYARNGWIIALFVLFFPAGLFLMWKYTNWPKVLKWLISAIFVFSVLISLIPSSTPKNQAQQTSGKKPLVHSVPKVSPKPTGTPSTPTPTPSDWVANPQCQISVTGGFDACLRDKYPLQASIRADSFGLYITNTQNVEWTECNVTLDDNSYATNPDNFFPIEAGSTANVPWGSLIDGNGNRFDDTKAQPGAVDITCNVNHEQRESQYGGFQ